jgi:hypothetical protein
MNTALELQKIVSERIADLRGYDVAAIHSLPPVLVQKVSAQGQILVNQYHDLNEAGEHRVIVQAGKRRWLGLFISTRVDGFVLAADGTKRPLKERETWPYI